MRITWMAFAGVGLLAGALASVGVDVGTITCAGGGGSLRRGMGRAGLSGGVTRAAPPASNPSSAGSPVGGLEPGGAGGTGEGVRADGATGGAAGAATADGGGGGAAGAATADGGGGGAATATAGDGGGGGAAGAAAGGDCAGIAAIETGRGGAATGRGADDWTGLGGFGSDGAVPDSAANSAGRAFGSGALAAPSAAFATAAGGAPSGGGAGIDSRRGFGGGTSFLDDAPGGGTESARGAGITGPGDSTMMASSMFEIEGELRRDGGGGGRPLDIAALEPGGGRLGVPTERTRWLGIFGGA